MKTTNGNVQDGLQHVLTQVNKAEFDTGKVGKFDMEFEGEGLPCNKCKFDVQLAEGSKPRLIEYKSYSDASQIQLPQFLNYIASVNNLSEMKYVFNAAKLTTEQAKEGMKVFMNNSSNKQAIFDAMKAELRQSLAIRNIGDLTDTKIVGMVTIFVDTK
ncbi:hypothetical protein [Dyadobacter sp. NIV53]|uniref:hypothetical protein n=1 Tax=Dyadobacter sp. NIV53 TaxID=2861765 RepID=UPI001C8796C8|nr:hypothetical protein [Dyadobacter sp. NIV53]